MEKIGLLTTTHAINYGAVLQAFSLKTALEKYTNKTVEVINYCGSERIAGRKLYRRLNSLKNIIIDLLIFFNVRYRNARKNLINSFDEFKGDYLNIHGKLITSNEGLEKYYYYKTLICGSDQIWNLNLFNDAAYFLSFVGSDTIKIAYAVSISDKMSESQMCQIAEQASAFSRISVREEDDAQILSNILGRNIDNLIDPVFLHNANEWQTLLSLKFNTHESKYLLVFFISHQAGDSQIVDMVKGARCVKVINLHPVDYIKGDIVIRSASPKEFMELIANADAILTDSFHCTAFSIIFNKTFFNVKRPTRNNRIENLYKKLFIPTRYISLNSQVPLVAKINYEVVNRAIKNEQKKAQAFLEGI